MNIPRMKRGEVADVCLLLEGTYPFVRGGVSSWVHQIISSLPEFKFSILFLGGIQLLSVGIIGEYIGRIYNETKARPAWVVARYRNLSDRESSEMPAALHETAVRD